MLTAYLGRDKWKVGANVTVVGRPMAGDTLVVDCSSDNLPDAKIVRVSVNILEVRVGDKVLRLAPLNPNDTVDAQIERGKKPMVVWVVQP